MARQSIPLVILALFAAFYCVACEEAGVSANGDAVSEPVSPLDAALAEVATLKARIAELEAERAGFAKDYSDFKAKYEKGCPYCPPDRPPEAIHPEAVPNHKLRDEIDQLLAAEKERQRRANQDEADASSNGPKEISIFCQKPPMVRIADLSDSERANNECMVLSIQAPDMSSRLVLYCDGTTSAKS